MNKTAPAICCHGDCNQGRNCPAAPFPTRRILGLNTSNSSVSQGAERVDTDEPIVTPDRAMQWSVAGLVVTGILAVVCFGVVVHHAVALMR